MVVPARRLSPMDRAWLIPLLVVALAVGSMASFSFYILRSAFDRDLQQNATQLAEGIKGQLLSTPRPEDRQKLIQSTLHNEVFSDPAVELVVFCDVSNWPKYGYVGSASDPTKAKPSFTAQQVMAFAQKPHYADGDRDIHRAHGAVRLQQPVARVHLRPDEQGPAQQHLLEQGRPSRLQNHHLFLHPPAAARRSGALLACWTRVRLSTTEVPRSLLSRE